MVRRLIMMRACVLLFLVAIVGCDAAKEERDNGLSRVSIQLNWYPEMEHGGIYQAQVASAFKEQGLEVEIRPGGRAVPIGAELELGRCQFAIANADDIVLARNQGLDLVAVYAAMQNHPRCILVREESGVKSFDDLKGLTLQRSEGRAYVEFLRAKGLLDGVHEVPYLGSVASLVADPKTAVQGYSIAEPFLARQQGVKVRTLMVSDLGMNPYSSVLVTSGKTIRESPELVRQFVKAASQGWQAYVDDPKLANDAILKVNKHGMTPEALVFGAQELTKLALPNGMPKAELGKMTADRWRILVEQLEAIGIVDKGNVDPESCYTTQFLRHE